MNKESSSRDRISEIQLYKLNVTWEVIRKLQSEPVTPQINVRNWGTNQIHKEFRWKFRRYSDIDIGENVNLKRDTGTLLIVTKKGITVLFVRFYFVKRILKYKSPSILPQTVSSKESTKLKTGMHPLLYAYFRAIEMCIVYSH